MWECQMMRGSLFSTAVQVSTFACKKKAVTTYERYKLPVLYVVVLLGSTNSSDCNGNKNVLK